MIAGAEAYNKSTSQLVHTNSYQFRVESLIKKMKNNQHKKPNPQVWIVAGKYKVHSILQNPSNSIFGREIYADHYDKVDLYNFRDLGIVPNLISDS